MGKVIHRATGKQIRVSDGGNVYVEGQHVGRYADASTPRIHGDGYILTYEKVNFKPVKLNNGKIASRQGRIEGFNSDEIRILFDHEISPLYRGAPMNLDWSTIENTYARYMTAALDRGFVDNLIHKYPDQKVARWRLKNFYDGHHISSDTYLLCQLILDERLEPHDDPRHK